MQVISPVNIEERKNLDIRTGDTVLLHLKIQEKGKTRLQPYEGLVIARKHGSEPGATITVRRVSSGVGMEKTFPIYSPTIAKIELVKRAKTRQSNLYYIREKAARAARRKIKNIFGFERTMIADDTVVKEEPKEEVEEVNETPSEANDVVNEETKTEGNSEEKEEVKEEVSESNEEEDKQ